MRHLYPAQTAFVVTKLDRRSFMRATGLASAGLVFGVYGCKSHGAEEPAGGSSSGGEQPPPKPEAAYSELSMFVSVGDDGTAQITVHRSEMGQGIRTALAMLVAEELCVRMQDVRVVQADGDPKYGDQNTDGSKSVQLNFDALRIAGAKAREMLVAAAAARLQVDADSLSAADSAVVHAASGRRLSYAELVSDAAKLTPPEHPKLRETGSFQIIGKSQQGVDNLPIVTGQAVFGIDVTVPGMLHASIERCPYVGGEVESYDDKATLAVAGVRKVVKLDAAESALLVQNGVAVIADTTYAAQKGRSALQVQWKGGDRAENTDEYRAQLAAAIKQADMPAKRVVGDVGKAERAAKATFEAEYRGPHLVHAPMEPPVAVADVRDGTAVIWGPIQDPQRAGKAVADALKLEPSKVTVHVTFLGGGFGRKSQPDFVIEAAKLSSAVGAPVKLTWTREDEVRHGFYRPENRQLLRASLNAKGEVTGILGRSLFPSLMKVFTGSAREHIGVELDMGWNNWPFDVPNMRAEAAGVDTSLRVGWWRSVCHTFHAFALCSFVDELADRAGAERIAYYKKLLGPARTVDAGSEPIDTARLSAVVDKVAGMGLWGRTLPKGEGLGFAAHYSFRSYVACVIHVAVDDKKAVTIKAVDYAVDCGLPVNPDGIEAQFEGGLVFGLSAALYGELTVKEGVVQERNFNNYKMLRINRMPKVNIAIIPSDKIPQGVGEPPVPPVAPALTNAIFAASGERIRELPIRRAGFS